jgi:hypothetical protein
MKVTWITREDSQLSGGHNTYLKGLFEQLRKVGMDVRLICLSAVEDSPTVATLRRAGFFCAVGYEFEMPYVDDQVRWLLNVLKYDRPDAVVINAVLPAAYYAAGYLTGAGIPVVGVCHVHNHHPLYEGLMQLITKKGG